MCKNINIVILVCLNLCLSFTSSQSSELSDIHHCSKSDPNLSECLRTVFQDLTIRSKNGIPELTIPPTDPLQIEKASYAFSNNIIQGRMSLRNLQMRGLSETVYTSASFKNEADDKFKTEFKFKIPKLIVEGNYKAQVNINEYKINSKGDFNVTMTDIDATSTTEGEWYERDGKTYVRLTKYNIEPTLGNMQLYASGLLPDPILNNAVLEFVNQNWRTVYKPIIQETRNTWEPQYLKAANEYLSHYAFDE